MNKRTLYLHIGCEKTGTTSIQNVLADNRQALLKQGIFYPDLGKLKFAQLLLPAALQPFDYPNKPRADYYPGNEVIDPDSVWNSFIDLAKKNADKDVIISAEHFSSRTKDKGLTYLKAKMNQLSSLFNIKIIVFLRRQDKFMESSYSTIIKAGGNIGFDAFFETHLKLKERYDFSLLLNRWSSFFDKSSLIVKDYETEVQQKGLLNSFFDITGIDGSALQLESENQNISWPASVIELARLCNTPKISPILANQRVLFLDAVTRSLPLEEKRQVYRFSKERRDEILQFYRASNKEVETEYFGGKPLFSELSVEESKGSVLNNETNISKRDIAELFCRFYMKNKEFLN
ncbi:hypothetical protein [Alteromonas mediterranea]|uniref:Sulfotransferase domain-containing protein n=1 Tax=Alteromonas mediterranea TaxID=314275 RepID=A0AAC8XMG9_9ALTE|nr:hypothetical protein [Alteromonas mediterranea]RPH19069.1 MAG: hypothetical protein CBB67_009655 [Alteromonadaceae bacterium TMED7]AFV87012.1 hypothetical protein amad1_17665 [Alteromonas mediterranea DE1]AGP99026.1 hypothetical protein I635_17625 [Alteromonas mediterranea UM7]AGQ03205.1 hypothetical protein I636_16875 [Alteromonas mediterranea UM4b]AMJ79932.1 hypothetical protein AV942_17400 [Alteromonas mediterranea]|tara:strand:- start:20331 stop:21368 length:1038 start_codon:yes stop_codon:yes gene_type:complete